MLLGLTIRDVVLIERLSLAFRPGLCVLTGETGAGKSILVDAPGLALGRRAEAGLVRPGAEQAAVAAEFAVGGNHPASAILDKAGIATDLSGIIVLRRIVTADGRSRAFVNDEPASVGLLRELGDNLVEIQGQGEQRGLLDPATHRELLDAFAEHEVAPAALAAAWRDWRAAQDAAAEAARRLAETRAEEDLLRHEKAELDALAPEGDEEDRLAARRAPWRASTTLRSPICRGCVKPSPTGSPRSRPAPRTSSRGNALRLSPARAISRPPPRCRGPASARRAGSMPRPAPS